MLFRGGHSKYNRYIRYIPRFICVCGGIGDISNIRLREEVVYEVEHLPHGGRVHPSLPLYTCPTAQTQVGVGFPPLLPLALSLWSLFIPKTMWLAEL